MVQIVQVFSIDTWKIQKIFTGNRIFKLSYTFYSCLIVTTKAPAHTAVLQKLIAAVFKHNVLHLSDLSLLAGSCVATLFSTI